ncbi:MAG TPA: ferritin-like domain-containing protein, partial [Acidimicrobiales bacterium]|nr:ferritin-like domain-containing protein [Acidimicrobiales bacterium]
MKIPFEKQMEENDSILQRMSPTPLSRRKVLFGGGVGALALVAAACGGDDTDAPDSTGDPDTPTTEGGDAAGGGGDVATAQLAAGLEVLAVNTYEAALIAAGDGTLPDVPEAVATFVTTAQSHHQAALDEWNTLLTALGEAEVTAPPADLETTVNDAFSQAGDVIAVAELALMLEQTAADTYFEAIPTIENA